MEVMGIKFAPLCIPFRRRLQTLAVFLWIMIYPWGCFTTTLFSAYLLFFTRFWWLMLLYLMWIFFVDNEAAENGGRRSESVRGWFWFKYFKEYFPITLVKVPGMELDPKKNYLFCAFPHGFIPHATIFSFGTDALDSGKLFPR